MKNLMRILSILIAFAGVVILIAITFDTDDNFTLFAAKLLEIVLYNILPIISISICAYCLEKDEKNYLVRIIPLYMSIPILLSVISVLFEVNAEWLTNTYDFLASTFLGVTVLSLISVINPNNQISKILKLTAFGIIAANVILALYSSLKSYMVETLPNVYGYQNYGGFGFASAYQTNVFITKAYAITSIAQIFVIILLYMTNYAFSDKIELDAEEIDYEAVKQDAINAANMQMQNKYNPQQTQAAPDRSASEKGLMNVNNQLGQNSNVGKVETQAKEVDIKGSSLDSLIPLSKGPVINANVNQEEPKQEQPKQVEQQEQPTPQPAEKPVEQTMPPNVDIQQEMQARVQQAQQQPQQPAPQQPTQNNQ